jgi:von Willebrand factor type A domain
MITSKAKQNYINHIAIVLDASLSMSHHSADVVKVADSQIKNLAEQSKIHDQETRVSVYTFSYESQIECLIYDKDVLRMPSISGLYKASGQTALCSATTVAIKDLQLTPEKYGEHAFLIYVVTDGQENNSRLNDIRDLPGLINGLPDHWTLAAFVPDASGVHFAKKFGFPAGNIAVWNTSDSFSEVGEVIRRTSETFMTNRAAGIRGSRNLFNMKTVDVKDIKKTLVPMTPGSYFFATVTPDKTSGAEKIRIDEFCQKEFGSYTPGDGLYEMTKRENIQDYKKIAIWIPKDNHLYVGKAGEMRSLLGLPQGSGTIRVGPGDHPDYKIFIESRSNNRNLFTGTELLVMR